MKRNVLIVIGIVLVLGVIGAACGAKSAETQGERVDTSVAPAEAPAVVPAPLEPKRAMESGAEWDVNDMVDEEYAQDAGAFVPGETTVEQQERMVIHTGQLHLIVDDVEKTLPQVHALVLHFEGYIVHSSSYRTSTDRLAAVVTLRVPASRYEEALDQLRAMAWKVETEDLSGQDVTEEFVDLQSRLKALEATEEELLALLGEVRESRGDAQEKAEAILAIYEQLTIVRSQIEQIQGRMKYLEEMSAMATITVQLDPREPEIEQPVVEEGFNLGRTFRDGARTLVSALQSIAEGLAYFAVVYLPFIAVAALVVGIVVWWYRRRRRTAAQ